MQDRRWANYEKFDDALVKLKASKDVNAFKAIQKTLANDQKVESQAILDLSANLKAISPEIAEKVNDYSNYPSFSCSLLWIILDQVVELQRADGTLREYQNNQAILAEKLVGGKINKQQFVDQEAIITKRKEECKEKIIALNSHLQSV